MNYQDLNLDQLEIIKRINQEEEEKMNKFQAWFLFIGLDVLFLSCIYAHSIGIF